MSYLVAPVGDVLFEDFEEQAEHLAGDIGGVDVGGGTVNKAAAELHTVGIVFAVGVVGEAAHEAHIVFELAFQYEKNSAPVAG